MDVRQTGVSDGNAVTARRYVPASASCESVGAERSPTAFSKTDGVRPSMRIRMVRLLRKSAEAGVLLPGPLACAERERRDRGGLEEADDRDQREREGDDCGGREQKRGAHRVPAA